MGTRAVKRATWMAGLLTAAALTGTPVFADPAPSEGAASTTQGAVPETAKGTPSATPAASPSTPEAGEKPAAEAVAPAANAPASSPSAAAQPIPQARPSEAGVPTGTGQPETAKSEPAKPESATAVQPETVKPEAAKQNTAADAAKPDASKPDASKDAATAPASVPAKDAATAQPASPAAPDAAKPAASVETPAAGTPTTAAAVPAVNPVVATALEKFADKTFIAGANKDDVAALTAFYTGRPAPLWIKDGAFSPQARDVIAEIRKAEDWGLDASAFDLPDLASSAASAEQGAAEAKLSLAVLKYARHARGGRVNPAAVSSIWDMAPPVKEPASVMAEISASATPGSYLTGLNPKHPQFEKLRQAMLKARGPQDEEPVDEALKVELPRKGTVKPGEEHDDIALLRKRLKVPAQSEDGANLYDAVMVEAVKAFQQEKGIKANGYLNPATRAALNAEGKPKERDSKGALDRILANMERWRWLPENLGDIYVVNNIPEYVGRVYKGEERVFEERIIVGQTTWPTPMLTSSMLYVIFRPSWGVPDGIKMKELLPRLRRASGGGGFFDQLFGGGSSGGARVLQAYGLKPTLNGRPVDANSIDWNNVDIRRFSFTQPAGGENPLGDVKFRFPNRHDVYMHDTTQKGLFAQSFRALSHGCIRVQNPERLAEVLLEADRGWDKGKVRALFNSGGEVTLERPVPVYITYFTARVDDQGKLKTYADVYGNDGRLLSALAGRSVRYRAPAANGADTVAALEEDNDVATGSTEPYTPASAPTSKKAAKKSKEKTARSTRTTNDLMMNALSGLVSN
ncbi:MAG: L,D-transpeptidase family protein [Hyphomicrobium sp.]|nr:L,D-transpeptidase family protein [Hyphomicrobium sp.]